MSGADVPRGGTRMLPSWTSARTRSQGDCREPEVRQRAADRRCLRVLQARGRVDLPIAFTLGGPACRCRLELVRGAIDRCTEDRLAPGARDEPRDDAALRKALVEKRHALGDRRVVGRQEREVGLRHGGHLGRGRAPDARRRASREGRQHAPNKCRSQGGATCRVCDCVRAGCAPRRGVRSQRRAGEARIPHSIPDLGP